MGGLDPVKILIVLLGAVILLGPERLPKAARQLGSMWRELLRLRERLENEVRSALPDLDLPKIPNISTRSVTGYITNMMTAPLAPGSVEGTEGAVLDVSGETGLSAAGEPGMSNLLSGTASAEDGFGVRTASGSLRPGWQPASDTEGATTPLARADWKSSALVPAYAGLDEPAGVPAGWQAVGNTFQGYASGANLSKVPSSAASGGARGLLSTEASLSFDDPSWN